MIFGLFGGAQATSTTLGAGVGQGFHDYIDFHVEADALGYHSTFCVEHHFTGWTQISATLNLLTWLAAVALSTLDEQADWNPVTDIEKRIVQLIHGISQGKLLHPGTGTRIPHPDPGVDTRILDCIEKKPQGWH